MHWKKWCRIYIESICTQKLLADFTNNYKETQIHRIKHEIRIFVKHSLLQKKSVLICLKMFLLY